jgi:1-acyl-sn-glycerol-3-phosphate acyltransferase
MQGGSSISGVSGRLGGTDPDATARTIPFRVVAAAARPAIRILFRPRASGLDSIPEVGFVLCSNQLSNLDGFALANPLYPRQVRWMGKAELFRKPLGALLRGLGIFPVRRGSGDVQAVTTAVELARAGHAVGIFPEGTRRKKGFRKSRQPRPHTGAARVALAAGAPLVPAAVVGTERLTLLRRWRVAFGAAVPLDDLDPDDRQAPREATRRLMIAIAALERELRAEAEGARRRLHPRLRLDVTFGDLLVAAAACFTARRGDREARLLRAWGEPHGLVCFSVRSAFELLLDVLALEPGDEIAFSAVTHPDMVRIAESHGLRPLPVDLDPATLAPRTDLLERAITPRTKLIVLAHLFGARADLAPVVEVARRHGQLVVEDCAQSLRGPHDNGDPLADVSLFSFGSIKTATALGGALVRVENRRLAEEMRTKQRAWPVQPRREYAARVLKFTCLRALAHPRAYWLFSRALAAARRDLDAVVNGAVRGFPRDELIRRIRRRPSGPLLALLARRLRRFDAERLVARARAGDFLAAALPLELVRPGRRASNKTHWVFPVVAGNPGSLIALLRQAGFDAASATSSIACVRPPADRPDLRPENAERALSGIVFLPAYPELGEPELTRLASVVAGAVEPAS